MTSASRHFWIGACRKQDEVLAPSFYGQYSLDSRYVFRFHSERSA